MENPGSCVWTDEEVGVLLNITLQYKLSKARQDTDWETCKQKYGDITAKFHEVLSQKPKSKDFPRIKGETTKAQLTTKLKNIRGKFKQAVESGRRSGSGRTVLISYEQCDRIWGGGDIALIKGFPRTPELHTGVETVDFCSNNGPNNRDIKVESLSPPESPASGPGSGPSPGPGPGPGPGLSLGVEKDPEWSPRQSTSPAATNRARKTQQLQEAPPLNGHLRLGSMKRRAATDVELEELQIKRSMLELLRTQAQRADQRMERLVSSMESLVHVISQSHAQLLSQSQCTCNARPLQAAASNSGAETDHTLRVTDSFTVKTETENSEAE